MGNENSKNIGLPEIKDTKKPAEKRVSAITPNTGQTPIGSEAYDIVLDIQRISDIGTGWPIFVSPYLAKEIFAVESEQDKIKKLQVNDSYTIVAVLGLFNRGKTFLLNKLGDTNLPSSKKVQTKGLSFLTSKKQGMNVILLDTAGTSAPLGKAKQTKDGPEEEANALAQKKTTEIFMQELAFTFADILVVVVAELTWPDQEFLKTLQQKLKHSNKQYKELFIVHNFSDVVDEIELLEMWRKYIVNNQSGNIVEQELANGEIGVYFREQSESLKNPSLHLFLAKEGSPAGDKWNHKTYELLKMFVSARVVTTKRPLIETLLENVDQSLKVYCKDPKKAAISFNSNYEEEAKGVHEQSALIVKTLPNANGGVDIESREWLLSPDQRESELACHFRIKAEGDINLKVDKVNFDGFRILLIRKENHFTPRYDVLMFDHGLYLLMDVPGFGETDDGGEIEFDITLPARELVITGERKPFFLVQSGESKGKTKQYHPDTPDIPRLPTLDLNMERPAGEFKVIFPLPGEIEDDTEKAISDLKDGVFSVFLPKKVRTGPKKFTSKNK